MFWSFNEHRGQDPLFPLRGEYEATIGFRCISRVPFCLSLKLQSVYKECNMSPGAQWFLVGKNYIEIEFLECAELLKWKQPDLSTIRWSIDRSSLMRNTVYLFSTWSCTRVFWGFRRVSVVLSVVWPYSHFSKHPSGPRIYPCFSLIGLRVSISVRKYPNFRGIYHWSPLPHSLTCHHTVTWSKTRSLFASSHKQFWLSDRLAGKTYFFL